MTKAAARTRPWRVLLLLSSLLVLADGTAAVAAVQIAQVQPLQQQRLSPAQQQLQQPQLQIQLPQQRRQLELQDQQQLHQEQQHLLLQQQQRLNQPSQPPVKFQP